MGQRQGPVVVQRLDADDEAFLRRVARAERRAARTGPSGRVTRAAAGLRPLGRRAATLLLILVAFAGLAAAAPATPARADLANRFCTNRITFSPERANQGLLGLFLQEEYNNRKKQHASDWEPPTRWGRYGTAGTYWTTYFLDCFSDEKFINLGATLVFNIVRVISAIAIVVFMWTFRGEVLNVFLGDNGSGMTTLDQMIRQVHADVFLGLFSLAVLIGALVLAWKWLFGRAEASDVLGKAGAMVLVAGFAMFYGGAGGGGPNAGGLLRAINDNTNEITAVVLSAFAGTDCNTIGKDEASKSKAAGEQRRGEVLDCAAEALYDVMIYEPWAMGMLGKFERAQRKADGKPGDQTEDEKLALRMLAQNAYSFRDIRENDKNPKRYTDARRKIGFRISIGPFSKDFTLFADRDICKDIDESYDHRADGSWTDKACDRHDMREQVFGVSDKEFDPSDGNYGDVQASGEGQKRGYWRNWSGGNADNRFGIAMLALIGSCSVGLVIVIVSLAYLMLQIASIMFALMAPVAFLFGLIPGFGMQVFLRWLELLLGTFIKRVVLGLFVGLLMAVYSVVLTTKMPWLMKLVMVCIIAVVGLSYRKRFTDAFTLNLSGSQAFYQDGEFAEKITNAIKATGSVAGKAVGAAGNVGMTMAGSAVAEKRMGGSAWRGAGVGLVRGITPKKALYAHDQHIMAEGAIRGRREGQQQRAEDRRERAGEQARRNVERAQSRREQSVRDERQAAQTQILMRMAGQSARQNSLLERVANASENPRPRPAPQPEPPRIYRPGRGERPPPGSLPPRPPRIVIPEPERRSPSGGGGNRGTGR